MSSHAVVEIGKVLLVMFGVWTMLCVIGAVIVIRSMEHVWECSE